LATEVIEERVAQNQHAFREANERIEATAEELGVASEAGRLLPFICECPVRYCVAVVQLSHAEYESVRDDGRTFLVAKGHETCEVEGVAVARVQAKLERYSVMQKVGAAGAKADELDERSG
jgi:hypothetical protein